MTSFEFGRRFFVARVSSIPDVRIKINAETACMEDLLPRESQLYSLVE